jgi:MYXO-CTERM domain-containing protein
MDPAAVPVAPGPVPVADAAPVAADEPQSGFAELDPNAATPLAGAGALGLMLLGGAAAMRRRKRRKQEEADEAAKWAYIQSHAEPERPAVSEPAFVRAAAPRHDPVPSELADAAPATRLPDGFDLSRFGPHVQAAYRGPTPDNPSLSLRNRLRRASFFDQQERRAAEAAPAAAVEEPASRPADAPATIPAKGNWESRQDADFLFYRAGTRPEPRRELQD